MNILVLIMLVLLFCDVVNGYKRGMVKSIISFVSLIFLSILVVLLGNGLKSYLNGNILNLIVVFILLCILGIVHHLLGVVFLPAKLVSKLPVVRSGDKLLGIVVGILETVLILWTVYALIMLLDMGTIGVQIMNYAAENPVLTWFYEHNYLVDGVKQLGAKFPEVNFLK
ncbi:MAG: CvpA family protein [Lachnospiraceae bacterium]|nr:CvpA family protein [Lachnospiraceae bacterium]